MFDWKDPTDSDRLTIVGKTGSGKTRAAAWHLSRRSFTSRPWIIFDFKGDDFLNAIDGVREVDITKKPPKKAGLYITHPLPSQKDEVDEFLWNVWRNERTGIYFDEGYMVNKSEAVAAILTQGRSKQIPLIMLSQRPVWLNRFAFSEASHFQMFWLNDARDRKTVQAFMPYDLEKRLPDYHSVWYDVGRDKTCVMRPVPTDDALLEVFHERLKSRRRKFSI